MSNNRNLTTIMKNEGLEIFQVSNGFVVRAMNRGYETANTPIQNSNVFQSMSELITYISEHFDHRSSDIESDKP